MVKNIVIFVMGVCLALFAIDYLKLKDKTQFINEMSYRCSQALFDDNEDWNEYALHVCQTLRELDTRIDELKGIFNTQDEIDWIDEIINLQIRVRELETENE